jgi:uncharacterized membrane protein
MKALGGERLHPAQSRVSSSTAAAARTPRLASDILRGWIAAGISAPFFFLVPIAAVLFSDALRLDAGQLITVTYYVGWTVFSIATVVLTLATFGRASGRELRAWLDRSNVPNRFWPRLWSAVSGGGAISWSLTGSVVALLALLPLATAGGEVPMTVVVAAITVVPASIAIIIVSFAVAYARLDSSGGFEFPGTPQPRFVDYLYLSVQATTTFGTSDVSVTTSRIRRMVSFHSLIAFGYNAFVIALLVSAILGAVAE